MPTVVTPRHIYIQIQPSLVPARCQVRKQNPAEARSELFETLEAVYSSGKVQSDE